MTRRVPFAKEGEARCTAQVANPTPPKDLIIRCGLVPHTPEESLHLCGGVMWRDKDE